MLTNVTILQNKWQLILYIEFVTIFNLNPNNKFFEKI